MLNSTEIARYIGSKLGITHAHIEIPMREMLDEVRKTSLLTFSHYYPYEKKIRVNYTDHRTNDYSVGELIIPSSDVDLNRILHIKSVLPTSVTGASYVPNDGGSVIGNQLARNLTSASATRHTFKFERPNKIITFPRMSFQSGDVLVIANMVHDKNFYTIPMAMEDHFKELALIDVKDMIFNQRKHFKNISTMFGSLELNIDDFEGMEEKRNEKIELFKANYAKSAKRKRRYTTRRM